MAFEFPHPYSHSPFSHSGLSMCMGDNQALMYDQIPPHIYDIIPPHGMSPQGPNNGSPANLPSGERTETKPRLHKDEVARLEKIFLENHKPNSNTKRGLADQMGVEVARINVSRDRIALIWRTMLTSYPELVPEQTSEGEAREKTR